MRYLFRKVLCIFENCTRVLIARALILYATFLILRSQKNKMNYMKKEQYIKIMM